MGLRAQGLAALVCSLVLAAHPAQAAEQALTGEWRLRADDRQASSDGPVALAQARWPGGLRAAPSSTRLEWGLRGRWPIPFTPAGAGAQVEADALAWAEQAEGQAARASARMQALHLSWAAAGAQWGLGKQVIEWDVGHGFRPNDLVQQQDRRSLAGTTPEGRPLLRWERFGADDAWALVWVNPQHLNHPIHRSPGGEESAVAARAYRHAGAWDLHAFARWGRHTRGSVGAAAAWVARDDLALHASLRVLGRPFGWTIDAPTPAAPVANNPWRLAPAGRATQALVGALWTLGTHSSLLLEVWHDGNAASAADWRAWSLRNQVLAAWPAGLPAAAVAGNLAWQATPLAAPQLQRRNLFLRWAWQPEAWLLSLDALAHPADGGLLWTAALQWQGDVWRFNAAWRQSAGPASALVKHLPLRRQAMLALTRAF